MTERIPQQLSAYAGFGEPPALEPAVLIRESTMTGWRGLSAEGEILDVTADKAVDELIINAGGALVGTAKLPEHSYGEIDRYLMRYNGAQSALRMNEPDNALTWINEALKIAPTTTARHTRALILLTLGDWREGFGELMFCERYSPLFIRPLHRQAIALNLRPWNGEAINGKRILLVHDHGLGDTIMCLRYVRALQNMGAEVVLLLPQVLQRLAYDAGFDVTANTLRVIEADYFCSFLHLLGLLNITPDKVTPEQYLFSNSDLADRKWGAQFPDINRPRIGVAWSVGVHHENDYPREISLGRLRAMLPHDAEIHSVQVQDREEAARHNVITHEFEDLADCAAFMMHMDEIVSIDTAALHLAGALGHPHVTGLLSPWHSWRWLAKWYPDVRMQKF